MNTAEKIDKIIKELTVLKEEITPRVTPCTTKGYALGDIFIVEEDTPCFIKDSIVELYVDDGTNMPKFKLLKGKCAYRNCDGEYGGYDQLNKVRKIAP